MDRTEIYIKMSDCEEIQELRPLKNYLRYNDGDILFAHWPDGTSYPVEKRERRLHVYTITGNNPEQYSKPIWLPRQDQLQEMLGGPLNELIYCLWDAFAAWDGDGSIFSTPKWALKLTSMEQLWLAFVMKEKHGKYWTDEGWKSREATPD